VFLIFFSHTVWIINLNQAKVNGLSLCLGFIKSLSQQSISERRKYSVKNPCDLPIVESALAYARAGWPVFPLQGKVPFKHSQGYKDATTNEQTLQQWWVRHPTANIGLATGAVSGVIVVDIDPRHNGHLSIKELERRYGVLPLTRTCRTAHKGLHRFYQHPRDNKTYPNAVALDGLRGIDVRGDGGYVVLPPSQLYGRLFYQWGRLDLPIAPTPVWLLNLLQTVREQSGQTPQTVRFASSPGEKWLQEALSKAREGNRNSVGFWLACQLRDDQISEAEARSILLTYANLAPSGKEPYTSKEAIASVRSAYSRPPRESAKVRRAF